MLQASPKMFQLKHPDMYRQAFGDGPGPVPPRLCPLEIEALAATFKCRPGCADHVSPWDAQARGAPTLHLPGGGLEQVAQALFAQMEKANERQERLI